MNFAQVYQRYQIPPNLQQHQLRVAGVAYLITKNWLQQPPVDPQLMARVGLVHDMGNILKFDLNPTMAQRYGLTNLNTWRQVKQEFQQKYGSSETQATFQICRELGLFQELEILHEEDRLYGIPQVAQSNSWPVKISLYADMRVSPDGIVSLQERLKDFFKRYHLNEPSWSQASLSIEQQLQSHTTIDITAITESHTKPFYTQFLNWQI